MPAVLIILLMLFLAYRSDGGRVTFAPSVERWRREAARIARIVGEPTKLILAIIAQESGGNPDAVGAAGELGLMQVTDAAARDVGFTGASAVPITNILQGTRYLHLQRERMGGSTYDALRAYNAGASGARDYNRGHDYASEVLDRL